MLVLLRSTIFPSHFSYAESLRQLEHQWWCSQYDGEQQHFWAPVSSVCYCSVCTCLQITDSQMGCIRVWIPDDWMSHSSQLMRQRAVIDWGSYKRRLLQASQLMVFHQWRIRVRKHDSQTFVLRADQSRNLLLGCLFLGKERNMKYSCFSSRNGRVGRMSNACELIVANSEDLTQVGTHDCVLEDRITRQTTHV